MPAGGKRRGRNGEKTLKAHSGGLPRPKRRFGQNFLADRRYAERIVALAQIRSGDVVVEIGPGRGAITELLAATGCRLFALEIDRDLQAHLKERFRDDANVEIVGADALHFDFEQLISNGRLKVVANLPYNAATPILFRLLDARGHISRMVLMFQREVAERITALPGGKDYGALSIFPQLYADIEVALKLPPGAFHPVPKVHSAVLVFDLLEKPRYAVKDEGELRRIVAVAFSQRRKMIGNALKSLFPDKRGLDALFTQTGIDPARRPETLSVEEFCRIGNAADLPDKIDPAR